MKNFDDWNIVKQRTEQKQHIANFKEREIFWANIGENIGFEQSGKGNDFMRPLLIFVNIQINYFLVFLYLQL